MPARTATALMVLMLAASSAAASRDYFLEQDMCVRCHLIGENLGAPNPVFAWKRSVHYRPDSGCAECHGGDKYFYADLQQGHLGLPDAAGANALCGKCHARETALMKNRAPGEPGRPVCTATCISCHGYHEVDKATGELINEANCGRCHSYARVKPEKEALDRAQARITSLENRINRIQDLDFPVAGMRSDLAAARAAYADILHGKRPGQYAAAAPAFIASLNPLETRLQESAPYKWYLSGTAAVGFLVALAVLLFGYQSVLGSNYSGREDKDMEENESKTRERKGSAWTGRLALIIALAALVLALQEKFMGPQTALQALNQTVTRTLAPELKKAANRDAVNTVYELKRMTVTLDEIRDTNANPEVRAKIDKLKIELQDLSVKLLVAEPASP